MPTTVYDIARKAGVSAATVSRVLNGRGGASDATVEKIHRIAEHLRFRPKTVLNRRLSVVVPVPSKPHFFASYFLGQMLSGVSDVLFLAGCELRFLPFAWHDPAVAADPMRVLKVRHADAAVFLYVTEDHAYVDRVARAGFPHVAVSAGFSAPHVYMVDCDHYQSTYRAFEYLFDLGHRNIGIICAPVKFPAHAERLRAYRAACAKYGGPADDRFVVFAGGTGSEDGHVAAMRLLSLRKRPTAVFASNDNIALGVFNAARKLGLHIPQGLSVVGFDDYEFCAHLNPPLTTVRQPIYEIGRAAAESVVRQMRGEKDIPRHVIIPAELIVRESAAPPGKNRHG
ncbi:MAG: LacI family DNA-binding transcriptional regulator [Planctomycetota bacterium]